MIFRPKGSRVAENGSQLRLSPQKSLKNQIEDILDYIFFVANYHQIFYLWRPFLKDSKDDMVLELAVKASCDCIVTYNKSDFQGIEQFGMRVMTPKEFLQEIGEL